MADVEPLNADEEMQLANMLIALKEPIKFSCEYKNWRGEVSRRRLIAIEFWHGSTEWHPEPGLMLKAIDRNKGTMRDFRVTDFDLSTLRLTHF